MQKAFLLPDDKLKTVSEDDLVKGKALPSTAILNLENRRVCRKNLMPLGNNKSLFFGANVVSDFSHGLKISDNQLVFLTTINKEEYCFVKVTISN